MRKTFELEWPDELGEYYFNIDNIKLCLETDIHVQEKVVVIREVEREVGKEIK